jgi:hypothetical protein
MGEPRRTLPDPLERIVERTAAASAQRGAARRRVESDLRELLLDALANGTSVSQIVRDYGDPELSGALIRRSPPDRSLLASHVARAARVAAVLATLFFGATYAATAARFESFARESPPGAEWLDSIANVAKLAPQARRSLGATPHADIDAQRAAITPAIVAARRAATSGDPFGRLVAAGVARDIVRAVDTMLQNPRLSDATRRELGADLVSLSGAVLPPLDSAAVRDWLDRVMHLSFDANGRLTATGLRIAQAMKGVREASLGARVLEPILFVNAEDARAAELSAGRMLSGGRHAAQRGDLWTTMIVRHAVDGLNAQADVAARLPELIAITQR